MPHPKILLGDSFIIKGKVGRGKDHFLPHSFFFFLTIYLIFGCDGSLLLCLGFLSLWGLGLPFAVVLWVLIAAASLVGEHRLESAGSVVVAWGLSCPAACSHPRPRIEPVSPALAGEFFTTEQTGKPQSVF